MNILFVSLTAPYPTSNGGHQRTNLLHKALSACGSVDFIALDSPANYTEEEMTHLREHYGLIGMTPLSASRPAGLLGKDVFQKHPLMTQIAHNLDASRSRFAVDNTLISSLGSCLADLSRYDLIVGRYTRSIAKLDLLNRGVPTLLDIDDLDSETYQSRMNAATSGVKRWILSRHYKNVKSVQDAVFRQVNRVWVANPENLKELPNSDGSLLPNIPFIDEDSIVNTNEVAAQNKRIMTIGSYRHYANTLGVTWFLDKVWPAVHQKLPDAEFAIYGSHLADQDRSDWQSRPGVNVIGFVEHVADAYADSALAICPVLSGAGTNIKVIEAGAHRRQCVMTRAAARGFASDPTVQDLLAVCDSPEAMTAKIVSLLENLEDNRQQADAFHAAVSTHYSQTGFNAIVAKDVKAVTQSRE